MVTVSKQQGKKERKKRISFKSLFSKRSGGRVVGARIGVHKVSKELNKQRVEKTEQDR